MNRTESRVAIELLRRDNLDGAERIAVAALTRLGDRGNSEEAWQLHLIRADVMRLRCKTDEALAYIASSETACSSESCNLPTIAAVKKTESYCLGHLGRYEVSRRLMSEAENLAGQTGILELQCEVLQCQAMIHYLQRDYDSSAQCFHAILRASDQVGGWYFRANALWGIGKNHMIQLRYHEAIPWLEGAEEIFQAEGAELPVAVTWSELAVCCLGLGDDRKSLQLLENAIEIQRKLGVKQNFLVGLANIGNVYLHRGDHLRAIEYYCRALELANEIKDPVSIQKRSYNIRLAYARLRDSVDRFDSQTVQR